MSSLKATNVNVNKVTSSSGNISGDKATGRIELEYNTSFSSTEYIVLPLQIEVEEGGFLLFI